MRFVGADAKSKKNIVTLDYTNIAVVHVSAKICKLNEQSSVIVLLYIYILRCI